MSVSMQARMPTSRWALGAVLASAFVVALGYPTSLTVPVSSFRS